MKTLNYHDKFKLIFATIHLFQKRCPKTKGKKRNMAQVKIYGLRKNLHKIQDKLSETIHNFIVQSLSFPKDKKYHRFIKFDDNDMISPDDKSYKYTIIEIIMMEGRTTETKKKLIKSLFENIETNLDISPHDIEICIIETPPSNWGFRGMTGDEIKLNYQVKV